MYLVRKAFASLPILVLVAAVGVGLASAALQDDEGPSRADREPGVDNFEVDGEFDLESYLAGTGAFNAAPSVYRGADLDLRVFGCATDSDVAVSLVPRADPLAELELEPVENFVEEPLLLHEGTVEDDPHSATVVLPEDDSADGEGVTPLGYGVIRVNCTDAAGEDAEFDTVIDVLAEGNTFEVDENDIVSVLDVGDVEA